MFLLAGSNSSETLPLTGDACKRYDDQREKGEG